MVAYLRTTARTIGAGRKASAAGIGTDGTATFANASPQTRDLAITKNGLHAVDLKRRRANC